VAKKEARAGTAMKDLDFVFAQVDTHRQLWQAM